MNKKMKILITIIVCIILAIILAIFFYPKNYGYGGDWQEKNIEAIGVVQKIETPSDKNVPYFYILVLDKDKKPEQWEAEEIKYIDAPNIKNLIGKKVKVVVDLQIYEYGYILQAIETYSIEATE